MIHRSPQMLYLFDKSDFLHANRRPRRSKMLSRPGGSAAGRHLSLAAFGALTRARNETSPVPRLVRPWERDA